MQGCLYKVNTNTGTHYRADRKTTTHATHTTIASRYGRPLILEILTNLQYWIHNNMSRRNNNEFFREPLRRTHMQIFSIKIIHFAYNRRVNKTTRPHALKFDSLLPSIQENSILKLRATCFHENNCICILCKYIISRR